MKSLGQTLRFGREGIKFTLRDVEDSIGVSNAYLSQLENDKIKKPSANVLYKLASLYKVELDVLLRAAGIIEHFDAGAKKKKNGKAIGGFTVSRDEEAKLLEYLEWLRYSKKLKVIK